MHVDNEDVHSDHDQMHRSDLAEKRAMKNNRNNWVNEMGTNISTAFNDQNYGKKYEELKEQAKLMQLEFTDPKFYSETRFAYSSEKV